MLRLDEATEILSAKRMWSTTRQGGTHTSPEVCQKQDTVSSCRQLVANLVAILIYL